MFFIALPSTVDPPWALVAQALLEASPLPQSENCSITPRNNYVFTHSLHLCVLCKSSLWKHHTWYSRSTLSTFGPSTTDGPTASIKVLFSLFCSLCPSCCPLQGWSTWYSRTTRSTCGPSTSGGGATSSARGWSIVQRVLDQGLDTLHILPDAMQDELNSYEIYIHIVWNDWQQKNFLRALYMYGLIGHVFFMPRDYRF